MVAVPVRGAGCVPGRGKSHSVHCSPVAVPVRGAGCVENSLVCVKAMVFVAVPVRGAGCVSKTAQPKGIIFRRFS